MTFNAGRLIITNMKMKKLTVNVDSLESVRIVNTEFERQIVIDVVIGDYAGTLTVPFTRWIDDGPIRRATESIVERIK